MTPRFFVRCLIICFICVLGFASFANAETTEPAPQETAADNSPQDLYAAQPKPMTVTECGRCHPNQFNNLRDHGGAHRFDCRDCHEIFHAYNPRRNNFAEIMPSCSQCHDAPHGATQTDCLNCHLNPHAPRTVFSMQRLDKSCADCHKEPAEQLQKFPSAHTQQTCQTCHSERHGRIPNCDECHSPHYEGQAQTACLACHPVHKPLQTNFTADADARTCAACHGDVFGTWSSTPSKHGTVNCTVCHTQHGKIPACTDCHTPPHDPKMMAKFKSCLGCHLDPHNLPIK